ncbi:protein kinase [Streptomyces sp. NPDC051784]|uniref:serine/threonine-protein kinase n=1 Tax=Streptomyces sp. NPDC051784 TaxID=3155805 RepID=UPI00344A44C7
MEKLGSGDPQRIDGYRLLGRLGSGGMGQVFLARSERGRTVAIKLVRPELAAQQHFRDRFRAEVQAARRVGGSWTAPVLDAGVDAAVPWVATGYIAGPSLHGIVSGQPAPASSSSKAYGPLPERSVRILGAGLAEALQDIHRAGLIHRDLKPSNVLMTIDGPRVIDFGIARALDLVSDGGLTRTGALVGSPGFMAPEQVRGEHLTPACDVFCLASVLVYAVTGRLPFGTAEGGAHALMFRIAEEDPDLTGVPEGIVELIGHCLVKDPAARPSTDTLLRLLHDPDTSDPWLPAVLIAQLGRHAVELLDSEDPSDETAISPVRDDRTLLERDQAEPSPPGATAPPVATPPATAPPVAPPPADSPPAATRPASAPPTSAPPASKPAGSTPPASTPAGYTPPASASPGHIPPGSAPSVVAPLGSAPVSTPPERAAWPVSTVPRSDGTVPGQPSKAGRTKPVPPTAHVAYGHPQPPGRIHGTSTGGPYPPEVRVLGHPGPAGADARRGRARSALLLSVVALLVALGTGWGVYDLLSDGHDDTQGSHSGGTSSSGGDASGDSTEAHDNGESSDGVIPSGVLGTWTGTVQGDGGASTRQLVLTQGLVGDPVLTLTAEGPLAGGGTYRCVFRASLAAEPSGDGPVRIGPSRVAEGEPMSSCTPGEPTVLTLMPDGTLHREITATGQSLTYTKSG